MGNRTAALAGLTPVERAEYHRAAVTMALDQVAPLGSAASPATMLAAANLHALLAVGAALDALRAALDAVVFEGAAIATAEQNRGG
jgi:hypothetical protein